jgi:hypothetical protein
MKHRAIDIIQSDIEWMKQEIAKLNDTPYNQRGDSFEAEWSDAHEHMTSLIWELKRVKLIETKSP